MYDIQINVGDYACLKEVYTATDKLYWKKILDYKLYDSISAPNSLLIKKVVIWCPQWDPIAACWGQYSITAVCTVTGPWSHVHDVTIRDEWTEDKNKYRAFRKCCKTFLGLLVNLGSLNFWKKFSSTQPNQTFGKLHISFSSHCEHHITILRSKQIPAADLRPTVGVSKVIHMTSKSVHFHQHYQAFLNFISSLKTSLYICLYWLTHQRGHIDS